ncbi:MULTISPECIES: DUF929 domain-containing protein [Acidianus]|uniref:DUF929 domain-containing protein n=1 Tax=Candidatus Acidianus copahuensis TaxID=1160895 RepID=A0A031LKM4_9CREN|nr:MULTISPECIES: DUF929 domain-containing protein [Acidianus]EZQ02045.1 hypothetical protein CM19_11275 [Candidatus Acidianus copahuensis]NON62961.1 DUF929 domain-containing protein [Acidianus sp. RZ1]
MKRVTVFATVVIIIIVIFIAYFLVIKPITSRAEIPYGKFVKVSNKDLAPPGKIIVVEQSWIGCPVGAVASWALYDVLSHYGNLSYYEHYSDPYDKVASNIPGLIFTGFKSNGVVEYQVSYLYNEYLNATPSGVPIPLSKLVQVGEEELQQELPGNVSSVIIKYETEVPVIGYNNASAFIVHPNHLNFAILISGPNGTYIVSTPLISPKILEGYSPSYVMSHLDNFPQIIQAANYINQVILMAAGPLASECVS